MIKSTLAWALAVLGCTAAPTYAAVRSHAAVAGTTLSGSQRPVPGMVRPEIGELYTARIAQRPPAWAVLGCAGLALTVAGARRRGTANDRPLREINS